MAAQFVQLYNAAAWTAMRRCGWAATDFHQTANRARTVTGDPNRYELLQLIATPETARFECLLERITKHWATSRDRCEALPTPELSYRAHHRQS